MKLANGFRKPDADF